MATIKYYIQSKSSNTQIFLRLSIARGKVYHRKAGLTVSPNDWSEKTGYPKQNNPSNKNLASNLRKLESFIIDRVNEANTNANDVNGEWLNHHIDVFFKRVSESKSSERVTDVIDHIVNNAHTRENGKGGVGLSECRINSYKRLKTLFQEFQKNKAYRIPQLDKEVFDGFKKWLLVDKGYSPTYSFKKLSDLKTVCKEAKGLGVEISNDLDRIKTRQMSAYDDDMDVIILTENDIEKIEKAHIVSEALINARKWLILACYTGQRGESLTTRVKEENFQRFGEDFIIKIIQKKGNKPIIIPVLPKVKEIYQNGLPYSISTQKLNKHFKELGKIAGIDEPVMGRLIEKGDQGEKRGIKKLRPKYQYMSTHIGRRSFASNHYGKIPTPIIMKVTGHAKESTFLTYINESDDSHVSAFFDFYKGKELEETRESKLKVLKNDISNG